MPHSLSCLRKRRSCCAFLTIAFTWEVQDRLLVIVTPRNLMLFILSTSDPLIQMGTRSPPFFLKSMISSLVLEIAGTADAGESEIT
eukprot:g34874.t1